jgi:hypothetical protein
MRDLEKYEQEYRAQPYERFQVKFRKREILRLLARYPRGRFLEIGCGLEPLFKDTNDFELLVVIEPAEMFYRKALADLGQFPDREARVRVHQVGLEACQPLVAGERFDVIVLSSLLHEVSDPGKFLGLAAALAGPETIVHVNVPNARSFHRLLAYESGLISSPFEPSASNIRFQQASVFELETLAALVERSGLKPVERGSYAFKPFTHQQLEDMLRVGLITEKIIEGFSRMEPYAPGCGSEIFINAGKK